MPYLPPGPPCESVLIVEDNADVRDTLEDALTGEGYEVHAAANGREALRHLMTLDRPALVLLDLMMPEMNGWEFLDAQRSDPRLAGHRVVTISAVPSQASLEDPTPLPIDGSVAKPLSLDALMAAVRSFCAPAPAAAAVAAG